MTFPEPNKFTVQEISVQWSRKLGPEFSVSWILRLAEAGHLKIEKEESVSMVGGPEFPTYLAARQFAALLPGKFSIEINHWITKKERNRFEENWKEIKNSFQPDSEYEHLSQKLKDINEASSQLWGTATPEDKKTHLNNDEVAQWLVTEKCWRPNLAESAATIIRPEWARKGAPPKS